MPNIRNTDRRRFQAWIWKEEKEILQAYAKQTGQTETEVFQGLIGTLKKKLEK